MDASLTYIIDHVFLPPKLPQEDDSGSSKDMALLQMCKDALELFQIHIPNQKDWNGQVLVKMVSHMLKLRDESGHMLHGNLAASLGKMNDKDVLAFHIHSQNAGLIVRRLPEQLSFESFELSPAVAEVISTKGRLKRCFPGPAIAIGQDRVADPFFRDSLVRLLTWLDSETPEEALPISRKAGSKTIEVRDTVHPMFITAMLMGILRGIGQPIDVLRIYKRTRDDVLWHNALKPWRRSPLWLLVRVALQSSRRTETDDPHKMYKSFMIFFMAYILDLALKASLPGDLLFVMVAKINKRTLKLAQGADSSWMSYVQDKVKAAHQLLAGRWQALEQNPDPAGVQGAWTSLKSSFSHETQLTLPNLAPYLNRLEARSEIPLKQCTFTPNCYLRIEQSDFEFPGLDHFAEGICRSARLFLADLELWVQDCLSGWLKSNRDDKGTCTLLAQLIEIYTAKASSTYEDSPEDISLMLLTTMELWVALDDCSTHHFPLLTKYDPGFPLALFDPLLLPKKLQMERLATVEQYLMKRRNNTISNLIFQNAGFTNSFSVRFFDQSEKHKAKQREIVADAKIKRDLKIKELVETRREYDDMKIRAGNMSCECVPWKHWADCEKCLLLKTADGFKISVHEWPLPAEISNEKSAVFELDVPAPIAKWRDITYSILVDIFSPPTCPLQAKSKKKRPYLLQGFAGLSGYVERRNLRLQLASTAKPWVVAHSGTQKIANANESNICVNNGLIYSMYDSKLEQWTEDLLNQCDVWKQCTLQLPSGSYKSLQYALEGTAHTSNKVLAEQSRCPKALNLHEFYAFTTLRSGHRLQWRNIARELVTRVLNFNHEETYMLLAQAAWQAGCSGDGGSLRESHIDLEEEEFGLSLLSVLGDALGTVERNWQGAVAVRTFAVLATRLLSMSSFPTVHGGCFSFLRRARDVTMRWSRDVGKLLHECQDEGELKASNLKVLEIALTCHGTFDVDRCHLSTLLSSQEDISVLAECSIIIHDRCPAATKSLPRPLKALLQRYERLSHLLEPILRRRILEDHNGMNISVRRLWAGYLEGSPWIAMKSPNERWLWTKTSSVGGSSQMFVHYNVLDGSLLVNGSPLSRLPRSYELHSSYSRLFGEKILDVIPSTMNGMVFETRNDVYSQQVHFGMDGLELIIRTRKQGQICELIPLHALHDDFPRAFAQEYTHWLNKSTGVVEWRPLDHAWESSPDNWRMHVDDHGIRSLVCGAKMLIDVHSQTAKLISQVLSPLEQATHVHVILNHETSALEVNLPRLRLDFFLNSQRLLESKQFRGMALDECQSFGAFTGLANKLILRGKSSRSVIVPHGAISFSPDGHHVRVMIDTSGVHFVRYHAYQIDTRLGRLTDNGSLQSRLFRLYLHATTSHCLVDQLTGRTGTEEAIYGLEAAATRSFIELEPMDIELLEMFSQLTPQRQYYPRHLRVMQEVSWETLSPLSQHCAFHRHVASILGQAKSFQVFQEQPAELPILHSLDSQDLLDRAAIRDSSYQVHGFGAETFTTDYDADYNSRDRALCSERELRTCKTAKLVDDWSTGLKGYTDLLAEMELWARPICGKATKSDMALNFDIEWLQDPAELLAQNWCGLQKALSSSQVEKDKYKVMMFLSLLSYSQNTTQELVHTLLAFATVPELRTAQPPTAQQFKLAEGYQPGYRKLVTEVEKHTLQYSSYSPEYCLPALPSERPYVTNRRRYEGEKRRRVESFVNDILTQWPKVHISTPTSAGQEKYISVKEALKVAQHHFDVWHDNVNFREYVRKAQVNLSWLQLARQNFDQYSFSRPSDMYTPKRTCVKFTDLTSNCAPSLADSNLDDLDGWVDRSSRQNSGHSGLEQLLRNISSRYSHEHERRYSEDLVKSFDALRGEDAPFELKAGQELLPLQLRLNLEKAQKRVEAIYQAICGRLQDISFDLAWKEQVLPRLSQTSILSHLASDKIADLNPKWKKLLVDYGLAIAAVQRAERLDACIGDAGIGNQSELLDELLNPGHRGWDPMEYPEWLLLEVENSILIRQDQAQISREMISPSSGSNSVMQLNMGLGKSSVIIPIVAAALADRKKLVRVIVLKPLATQMFHLLVKKLGGMLNRRVLCMPISRSLNLDMRQACQIRDLYKECMDSGGILLLQPEHILSFELMGLDQVQSGNSKLGNVMIETQHWLQANTRDILDESDEILSVRFELIYAMGLQRTIEFSPDRWIIIEHVMGLVGDFAKEVEKKFPNGLEVMPAQPGGFPRIRILQSLAGDELLSTVAGRLLEEGLPGVPVWQLPPHVRTALFIFITDAKFNSAAAESFRDSRIGSGSTRNGLLLLRGLFAGGVLKFAFGQKRWRVNYGLDLSRTMLAVPYHAKDSPAARAEFSHPDAAIVLTCLSYYYGGLSDQQIRASFETLLQYDHAQEEYALWVLDAPDLPGEFKQITGINLSDTDQCYREVFPPLRFARRTINFYMSKIVFPAEMKEFPHKLSSSGWDIAMEKSHPTTGFSGTNDSRYVLPLSICQCDLPPQLSTNAAVLDCLLRPENSFADVSQISKAGVLNAEVLLDLALKLDPPVSVILDVGAQVLELQNEEMARTWLSRVPGSEAQAAIYFNNRNEICVLSRDGTKEPLLISPFAKQMDKCLVYLDEAHTRGTDLKMPQNHRAIVTLGPGLTKDRLVQACMRMRKLGKGQSVVFCSSTEIQQKILGSSGKGPDAIEAADVLRWCIVETCAYTRRIIPLWAAQGVRHQRRREVYSKLSRGTIFQKDAATLMLEAEAQSLEQRYEYRDGESPEQKFTKDLLDGREKQLEDILAKCQEFGVVSFNSATLQEEQERELSPENEREQQVELPPASKPHEHVVHKAVRLLATQGVLNRSSDAFQSAFETLRNTTAFKYFETAAWPQDLLVTADFSKTIGDSSGEYRDSFLRPVHWIVSCDNGKRTDYVILSPYEAQELLLPIRKNKLVTLHLYSPRLSVSARALDSLSFCAIPATAKSCPAPLKRQLNIFAGQLYFRNYGEYLELCDFLGLSSRAPDNGVEVACDGFINPRCRVKSDPSAASECPFTISPVPFLRMLVAIRRKGQDFTTSQLGKILNGELIKKEQF